MTPGIGILPALISKQLPSNVHLPAEQSGESPRGGARHEAARRIWPRIGLWGRFDVASLGDLIGPRVFESEIRRRLPRVDIQTYAPLGPRHPVALDGGSTAKALGAWSRRRTAELAEETDCVVIGGGDVIHTHEALFAADYGLTPEEIERLRPSSFFIEGLGPSLERRCPIAWNAVGVPFPFRGEEAARVRVAVGTRRYLSVRDLPSKERLREAGVASDVEVVPDPILLAARAFPSEVLDRRLDYLKFMDWFPTSVEPIVVQGAGYLVSRAPSIAASLLRALRGRSVPVVLLETEAGRGEADFLDAIAPHLGGAVFRIPSSAALSDIVAVLAHARVFVGTSAAATLAAAAFGVPTIQLGPDATREADAAGSRIGEALPIVAGEDDLALSLRRLVASPGREDLPRAVEERLETHFDRLAEIAESAMLRRSERGPRDRRAPNAGLARTLRDAEARGEALRAAYQARTEQMLEQRFRIVEALEGREMELRTKLKAAEERLAGLSTALDEAREQRSALTGAFAQARADLEASHARELEAQRTMEASRLRELQGQATMQRLERDLVEARSRSAEIEARLTSELAAKQADLERLADEVRRGSAQREGLLAELATLRAGRQELEESARRESRKLARAEGAEKALAVELERVEGALARANRRESSLVLSRLQALAELDASRAELGRIFEELESLRARERGLEARSTEERRPGPGSRGRKA